MTADRTWRDGRDRGGTLLLCLVGAVAVLAPVLNLACRSRRRCTSRRTC
jgi:hypothetical protein